MEVLVAGADRVDAGKTTFATGLVARTGARAFKPRAGNDHWHHHEAVETVTGEGRLVGSDARRLASAAGIGADAAESINPVHRLWRPAPGPATGLLGGTDREFLVDRVGDSFVLNGTVDLPRAVTERLPLTDARAVESLPEFNRVMTDRHLPALADHVDDIADSTAAVVESYADVARPARGLDPDAVAVVQPRRVRVYDGDRYLKACEVAGDRGEGVLEERVDRVLDLLDPAERAAVDPLDEATRADPQAVADAYEHAYDAVLRVAGE